MFARSPAFICTALILLAAMSPCHARPPHKKAIADQCYLLGINIISVLGFAFSGLLGMWLLWGVVRSGRL